MIDLSELCSCDHTREQHSLVDDIVVCAGNHGICTCWEWDPLKDSSNVPD